VNSATIIAALGRLPDDDGVLGRALALASTHRAALIVVHVVDISEPCAGPASVDALREQAALAMRDRIEEALLRLGADPSAIEIVVEPGAPALRLREICVERQPGLIVMRAHERRRIVERFVGSTAERVVAASVAPALILRRPADRPYRHVLVATDGRDAASEALSFAAKLLPDAALHLVRAVNVAPQLEEAMLRIGTEQAVLTSHREALIREARDQLGALAESVAPRATTRVLDGEPGEALVRATRVPKADLVVVGPGRAGPVRRFFVGSVTRRLLHEAACDVLVHDGRRTFG
jgi:nucleotide-binding universal stress UspA family protein